MAVVRFFGFLDVCGLASLLFFLSFQVVNCFL